jgi:hypothetical protein
MTPRYWLAIALLGGLFSGSCRRAELRPASQFNVADRVHEWQLTRGFHPVETAKNRWAAREFAVVLRAPGDAAAKGARIWLRFFVPGEQIEKLGPITLYADVDGYRVEPQKFSEGGIHEFIRDVPGSVLDTNIVPVQFAWDKAVDPASGDGRELGAVIIDVGLRPL